MAGVNTIWFVPGFLGSELWARWPNGGRRKLWLDVPSLLRGSVATDLIWDQPPAGSEIVPGSLLNFRGYGYPGLEHALIDLQAQTGYQTRVWTYDWRAGVTLSGLNLAYDINRLSGSADNKILAHSMGGLVAAAADVAILQLRSPSPISTIVTLGTPWSGSYSPFRTFRVEEDSLNVLALFAAAPRLALSLLSPAVGLGVQLLSPPPDVLSFLTAYASWPAVYDLMANPDMADDVLDVFRPFFWNSANWTYAPVPPSASLMAASANGWQKTCRTPPYVTTFAKYLRVAGTNRIETPQQASGSHPAPPHPLVSQWTVRQRASQCPQNLYGSLGDGTVTTDSALGLGAYGGGSLEIVGADHTDLPTHPLVLANLAALLNIPASTSWPPRTLQLPSRGQVNPWPATG